VLGQRQAPWNIHHLSMWPDPADNERNIASTRALATAMQPWTTGRADLNFIGDEGQGRVAAAYGREKSARLEERKASGIRRTSSVTSTSVPPTNGRASSSPGTVSSTSHARAFEHETRVRCSSGQRCVGSPDQAHVVRMAGPRAGRRLGRRLRGVPGERQAVPPLQDGEREVGG